MTTCPNCNQPTDQTRQIFERGPAGIPISRQTCLTCWQEWIDGPTGGLTVHVDSGIDGEATPAESHTVHVDSMARIPEPVVIDANGIEYRRLALFENW